MPVRALLLALTCALLSSGCGGTDDGTLDIAFIAEDEELHTSGLRLSEPAQHLRAATAEGLVARDATGEVVPALADRWIVTDDGLSFIFRLRGGTWPDGTPLTAQSARAAFLEALRGLEGTSMGLDLAPIAEVRAMAGRVIEIRLSGPSPALLQLLAQPELALEPEQGTGAMSLARSDATALLELKPPEERGLPENADWREDVRLVRLTALPAEAALAAFDRGEVDAVLGGRIDTLPLVDIGPLSLGTVRLDPAIGLFGLQVRRTSGLLASEDLREAIAMALDRPALIAPFALGGWTSTTRIVTPALAGDPGYVAERWSERQIEQLRAEAGQRIARWRAGQPGLSEGLVPLTIEIGDEPGLDILFEQLAGQLAEIGIRLERAPAGARGDLVLIDRVARYAAPNWFLNQFHCSLRRGPCSEEADFLVEQAVKTRDLAARAAFLAQAESVLAAANLYIPIGTPIRWSLIRGTVGGFEPNRWAFHPLPPMAEIAR